jgi:signal peptidase
MEPELRAGDAVVVRPVTSATQLRKGQVVTFVPLQSSQLVTHRIEALATVVRRDPDTDAVVFNSMGDPIKDAYVKTKGDANESADPGLTPASQVRGIVREVRPSLGWALWWAHSPFGRLMLFAPPLLMLVTAELLSRMPAQSRPWHHLARRRRHDARAQEQSHALD